MRNSSQIFARKMSKRSSITLVHTLERLYGAIQYWRSSSQITASRIGRKLIKFRWSTLRMRRQLMSKERSSSNLATQLLRSSESSQPILRCTRGLKHGRYHLVSLPSFKKLLAIFNNWWTSNFSHQKRKLIKSKRVWKSFRQKYKSLKNLMRLRKMDTIDTVKTVPKIRIWEITISKTLKNK